MTELNVKYPVTTAKPEPSGPGFVIHSYIDLTPHQGEDVYRRYSDARSDEERDAILADMPRATVTFHELPEGEDFFDMVDRPQDKNGYAVWDTVWVKDPGQLGCIEAAHGDEYDIATGDIDHLTRMTLDQFKPLDDMTDEDHTIQERQAAEERSTRAALASTPS